MYGYLKWLSVLVFVTLSEFSECARILALFPYNARSHFVVMEPLLLALQEKGHHITVVSSFPQKKPLKNYRDIDLSPNLPVVISQYTVESIKKNMPNRFKTPLFIMEIHTVVCEKVMNDERVMNLLDEQFDLVIGEIFGADCFNYFVYKLNVPLVTWVTSTVFPWGSDRVGLPDNPSYIPNYFVDYPAEMNFFQRLQNTVTLLWAKAAYHFFSDVPNHRLAEVIFNSSLPTMDEVNRLTSLVLVNSHYSLSQSRPFPPNVVEVGGIHIKPVQPLQKELKDILDKAKEGVILFSFGSLVRAASLPPQVIRMFLRVFATLPQTVVFKYEESLSDLPPNVVVRQWLPQADIAAHPNVRVLITHCGLASTTEAVHFAKPIIGVPFFSDQFQNAKNIVRRGAGIMIDIDNLSEEIISQALKAVLHDPRFTENMKRLSLQFHDRPMTALQSAVYWTEYVIRHKGAPHLRPASVNLPLYQYLLLDVFAITLGSLIAVIASLCITTKILFRVMRRKKGKQPAVRRSKKVS